ncbi:MAG: T9SS type A sorting domain-containing protein, partial [Flavobacteriales bacterium]|nr:T9SS type A sorting domain-containing protein [Flavobacteriales bacterium]
TDLPENDMALLRARLTGFDFDNTGLANIDYSIYPLSQVRGMQLNGEVKNKGYATQTNTMLNVSVDGPMGNEFTGSSNSLDMAAAQVEFPSVNGFVPSGDLGTYTVTFEVVQDQTDEDPSNNGDTQSFMVSSNEWAQDDGVCESTQSRGPDNQNEAFWLGNRVDPVVDDQLVAIKVALHEDTDPNVLIQGQVLDGTDAVIAMSNEYEVLPGDLNPIGGSNFITLTFDQPVDLLAGEAYTLMVATFGGPEEVVFCTSGISVPQVSLIHYPQMATPNFFYVTKTPMVRGVMAGPIGIDENNGPLAGGLSLLPNPADGFTDVRFELLTSAQVSTELRDASGRTVMIAQPTRMSAGPQTVRMDLEALAPGLYLHTLVVDGQRNTVRLVVR